MNAFRQQAVDQTASRFHDFTPACLQVSPIRGAGAWGVLLAEGPERKAGLVPQVRDQVGVRGVVAVAGAVFGHSECEPVQGPDRGGSVRGEEDGNRFPAAGDPKVALQALAVTALAAREPR